MPPGSKNAPESRAREQIYQLLEAAGWELQERDDMNVSLPAVPVREFKLDKARLRCLHPLPGWQGRRGL